MFPLPVWARAPSCWQMMLEHFSFFSQCIAFRMAGYTSVVMAAARAAAAMGGAADAAQGGVGGATLGTGAAVDVAGVARGATENAVCDGVGQLSDPLERHVI